jgi:hypothetical protein
VLRCRNKRAGVLIAALCLVPGGLLLAPGVAGASQAAAARPSVGFRFGPPWRVSKVIKVSSSALFEGVAATGRDSALAIADTFRGVDRLGGFAMHWNGKGWRRLSFPVRGFVPVSVSEKGNSGAWVFGWVIPTQGETFDKVRALALVRQAGHWHVMRLPAGARINWVTDDDLQSAVAGPESAWVVGSSQNAGGTDIHAILWHWNGSAWTRDQLHVADVTSISAASPGDAWAVGNNRADGTMAAFRWRGQAWDRVTIPAITHATVAADSAADVWVAGAPVRPGHEDFALTLNWNGHRWRRLLAPVEAGLGLAAPDGRGGVWLGMWAHRTGGQWRVPSRLPSARGCDGAEGNPPVAAIPGTRAAWLAGTCPAQGNVNRGIPFLAISGRL